MKTEDDESRIYRILLADDHALFRQSVRSFLEGLHGIRVLGEAGDGLALLELLKRLSPHMVLLDISMPNLGGIEAAGEIKREYPDVKVLILSMHKDKEYVQQAILAGAEGYVLKENMAEELFPAIETIREGKVYFPLFP